MVWERPTLKQLYERISQDFSGRLLDGGRVIPRSVIAVFAKIWAGACNAMHGVLEWAFLQVFIDTAETVYLERWTSIWDIFRKPAAHATGKALFSGQNGSLIPAGTLLVHQPSGQQYALQGDVVFKNGQGSLSLAAVTPGAAGNQPAATELTLIAPVAGVQSKGLVDAGGLTGGTDAESDEGLRARLLARLRQPPRVGAKHDYEYWALEVPGVTRAWCYPLAKGIGTVTLTFVTDNAPTGPIPTAEMVRRVQAHIDALRPATVKEFEAFAPTVMTVPVKLSVTPNTAEVRQAVRGELADLMAREAKPDTTILLSHFKEAISLAPGETDHSLFTPAGDVLVSPGVFPTLGAIEFVGG